MGSRLPRFLAASGGVTPPTPPPPGFPGPVANLATVTTPNRVNMDIGWNRGGLGAAPDHFRLVAVGHDGVTISDLTAALGSWHPSPNLPGLAYGDEGFGGLLPTRYPITFTVYALANGFTSDPVQIQSPAHWSG